MSKADLQELAHPVLSQADVLLSSCLDYEATIQKIVELAVPRLADWCIVDVVDADGKVQRVAAAHADPTKAEQIQLIREKYPASPKATRGVYRVLETGRSILIPELNDDIARNRADDSEHLRLMLELGHKSYMCVPLIARGNTIGTILLYSSDRIFGHSDLGLAEELARRFALAVDNARLYREAHQAIRVRDEFISVAAHELRTPLTILNAQQDLISHILSTSESHSVAFGQIRTILEMSDKEVKRLNHLVNVLLDISKLNGQKMSLKPTQVDLAALVRDAFLRFQSQIEASACSIEMNEDSSVIGKWDQIRIEQVIDNLLSNAIKYGPGGRVAVSVSSHRGYGVLRVEDSGCGIQTHDLPKIFEPFERVGNYQSRAGLGLGLYICRAIVEAHQGTISASSQLGRGSVFEVRLPLST